MNSMTGFGRGSFTLEGCTATIEISGVNRKQAEIVVVGIRDQPELEDRIRKAVAQHISRGRLQVAVSLSHESSGKGAAVDKDLASQVMNAFNELSLHLGRTIIPEASDFMRVSGLISFGETELDPELAWQAIEPALKEATEKLLEMRQAEGSDLVKDLVSRLDELESIQSKIAILAPQRPERQREQLLKRLADVNLEIDLNDERVLKEIALFADRCDITEELTRLTAHLGRFREYLAGREPAGRPLDFLCQEIHREFNTIGSKASDAGIAQLVVTAKSELEKIREQVQNLE